MTPAVVISAPAECTRRASSRSIHSPDSLVSRPTTNRRGRPERADPPMARTSAPPRRATVSRSRGYSPAFPRTPSVPNSRWAISHEPEPVGLLDRHVNDGGNNGAYAKGRRRCHLGAEIVYAKTGTV